MMMVLERRTIKREREKPEEHAERAAYRVAANAHCENLSIKIRAPVVFVVRGHHQERDWTATAECDNIRIVGARSFKYNRATPIRR